MTQLTNAWTFHYGAGSKPSGNLELGYRLELQPLIVGGVMHVSTPALREDPDFKSTISAIEPETGKLLWKYTSPRHIHERGIACWTGTNGTGLVCSSPPIRAT